MNLDKSLYPIIKDKLYGYIDGEGNILIPPRFSYGGEFSDGIADVVFEGKSGYISKTGDFLFHLDCECCFPFSEGLAEVQDEQYKCGYVNKAGKLSIDYKFERVFPFHENTAVVCVGKKWGAIDKKGQFVIEPQFDFLSPFKNGLAAYRDEGIWGIVNATSEIIFKSKYERIWNFSENKALVLKKKRYGYIDLNFQEILPLQYYNAGDFHEALAAVSGETRKYSFVDENGIVKISGDYSATGVFLEGACGVCVGGIVSQDESEIEGGGWGVINMAGQFIAEPIYDSIEILKGGVFRACFGEPLQGGKLGYLNSKGEIIWDIQN